MDKKNTVSVIITLKNDLDSLEHIDRQTRVLLNEIKQVQGVEQANLSEDLSPPSNAKGPGGFLIGVLTAEVNAENLNKVFSFLGSRLMNKTIEVEVEAEGKRMKVKVGSKEELETAVKAAKDFLAL